MQLLVSQRILITNEDVGGVSPSVETAKKIATFFHVSIDYLMDEAANSSFDPVTIQRLKDIEKLEPKDKDHLFALMDAFLRDAKTKKAYS